MKQDYLALDLGAESGRGMLAHIADGRMELRELHRFANVPVRLATGLYWDVLRLFGDICESIRAAGKTCGDLAGIGIDTWGVDFALIGPNGELLENPHHYRDARTRGIPQEAFRHVPREELFQRTGVQFMDINSLYQLCAKRKHAPQLLALSSKLLFMPDLFNYLLAGTLGSERTIASTSQFYDPRKQCFALDILHRLGIDGSILPELRVPGTELGFVLPYISDQCGLRHDTVLYATASHDTASAVAAVPALSGKRWCYISSGTWSLMGVETNEPIISAESLEANFTNEAGVEGTIRFLKNIPGLWLVQECRRAWAAEGEEYSYAELMKRAVAARPIDTILDLEAFNAPGNHPKRIVDFCRKTGQEVPENAGSMCRVILQSLAARYREVLQSLERLTGSPIEVVHIVGGGSRNKLLNQLAADYMGRTVIAGPPEATAAGNALTQALGAGEVASLQEMREIVGRSFEVEAFRPTR